MLTNGTDKHKTREWMLLMQAVMQEELCRHFLLETALEEDRDLDHFMTWLNSAHQDDTTLTFLKQLLQVMQHRELFHWVSGCLLFLTVRYPCQPTNGVA
jgi:hypothetical protein